jgi:hypothetical protein
MKYADGKAILKLCDEFEKVSKKLFGDYRGAVGVEKHRILLNKVRNIVEEAK